MGRKEKGRSKAELIIFRKKLGIGMIIIATALFTIGLPKIKKHVDDLEKELLSINDILKQFYNIEETKNHFIAYAKIIETIAPTKPKAKKTLDSFANAYRNNAYQGLVILRAIDEESQQVKFPLMENGLLDVTACDIEAQRHMERISIKIKTFPPKISLWNKIHTYLLIATTVLQVWGVYLQFKYNKP